jgi:hypothetical protein
MKLNVVDKKYKLVYVCFPNGQILEEKGKEGGSDLSFLKKKREVLLCRKNV